MRKKQAAPDERMADEMGVSSYIPKNVKLEGRVACVFEFDTCDRTATHEVSVTDDGETKKVACCERHAKEAQVVYNGTVSVRRMKLV